jgi:hypothetical protein
MYNLPGTVFRSKDHRSPQSEWSAVLPCADLGLGPLYLHNVSKLRSHILPYGLEADNLAISETRCSTLQGRNNLLPSLSGRANPTHGRAKRVSEAYIFSVGEELLLRLRVPFYELRRR